MEKIDRVRVGKRFSELRDIVCSAKEELKEKSGKELTGKEEIYKVEEKINRLEVVVQLICIEIID